MHTVQYPSPVVPGPPPLSLEMPAGWEQVWAPDSLIAIRQTEAPGDFRANVVVRFFQRVAPFGPDEAYAELGEYATTLTQGALGPRKVMPIAGREWVGADITFEDARIGAIGQVHWLTASAQNDVLDVIQVTGSYAAPRREQDYALIDTVVSSLRIDL